MGRLRSCPLVGNEQQFLQREMQGAFVITPRLQKCSQMLRSIRQNAFEFCDRRGRAPHPRDPRVEIKLFAELLARNNLEAIALKQVRSMFPGGGAKP